MSDGISDAYKHEREERAHSQYLMAVATHLVVKTQDTLQKLEANCSVSEAVMRNSLDKLLNGDKSEWCRFLLSCQEHNSAAYERARSIAPWPKSLKLGKIYFDRWSELGSFFRPFFRLNGYATDEGNGNRNGYDSYAVFYDEDMSIKQIVKESIWVSFKTTGWPGNSPVDPVPTTPLRKDRKK